MWGGEGGEGGCWPPHVRAPPSPLTHPSHPTGQVLHPQRRLQRLEGLERLDDRHPGGSAGLRRLPGARPPFCSRSLFLSFLPAAPPHPPTQPTDTPTHAHTPSLQIGANLCDDQGRLTQLNWQGYEASCPFPGDLFTKLPQLQALYLSANNFTVGGWEGVGGWVGGREGVGGWEGGREWEGVGTPVVVSRVA